MEEKKADSVVEILYDEMKTRGRLINKLERKLRKYKRRSAAQHRMLSATRRWVGPKQDVITAGKAYTSAFGRIGAAVPYVPLSDEEKKDADTSQ